MDRSQSDPNADGHNRASSRGAIGVVLLAGSLVPSPLVQAAGCSVLSLWLAETGTVLDHWIASAVRAGIDREILCVFGGAGAPPTSPEGAVGVRIVQDRTGYRGPAGSVRDAVEGLGLSRVVIAEGARYLTDDLGTLLEAHEKSGADVAIARNPDGSPAGLYVASERSLALIPHAGYLDLKEQWLQKVSGAGMRAIVHDLSGKGSISLRTREHFIRGSFEASGLRRPARTRIWGAGSFMPGAGRRGVVAKRAEVSSDALVMDSVVMPGARIEPEAVVLRSIVMPGAVVSGGDELVETVAAPKGRRIPVGADTE